MKNQENDKKKVNERPEEAVESDARSEAEPEEESIETLNPEQISQELENVRTERDDYLNHLQRLKAEFDNYRKRVEREKQEIRTRGTANLVADLLEVLDNFERATESAQESGEMDTPFGEGVQMTFKMLFETLKKKGLEPIESLGQPFDPEYHEAMSTEEHTDLAPNTVVNVWQKGYLLGEKVLRPAKVVVSVKGE